MQQHVLWPATSGGDALIEGPYRYVLRRWWGPWKPGHKSLLWVLLNPSTADSNQDDPTLRRCVAFTRRLGYDCCVVVNLFAYRCTEPEQLNHVDDPTGPSNNHHLFEQRAQADAVIIGWGSHGTFRERDRHVLALLTPPIWCFGMTQNGSPRHPLYLRRDEALVPFVPCSLVTKVRKSA